MVGNRLDGYSYKIWSKNMINTLLITLWFSGYNITIDASQLYNITTLKECNEKLLRIRNAWGSTNGTCFVGDIIKDQLNNA